MGAERKAPSYYYLPLSLPPLSLSFSLLDILRRNLCITAIHKYTALVANFKMRVVQVQCHFTSIGTGDQDGHLDFHTAPEL